MYRNSLIILVGMLSLTLNPAYAQVQVNMNRITCKDFLNYNFENKNFVGYWMSGYYSASKNNDVLDLKRLQRNAERITACCKRHRAQPLAKAININAL